MQRPWFLLEVTRRCDRNCIYCYANGNGTDQGLSKAQIGADRELSGAQLDAILDRLLPQVMPRGITLIGGEPLVNVELPSLVRQIARRHIAVSISTNALTLSRARIDELVGAGATAFEVSFDSPDRPSYAELTGSHNSSIERTLCELVRSGVVVSVGAMLTRRNLEALEALLKVCFALGVARVSLNQVALVGSAQQHASIVPTDTELATALDTANTLAASLGLRVAVGLPLEPCRMTHQRYPALEFETCRCGESKWMLEPSGDVRVCELATESIGNLHRDSWQEIVMSSKVGEFRDRRPFSACESCEHENACLGGCRFRRGT